MQHVKVDSSNIESIGYDPEARVCEVLFRNGGHYAYQDVPPEAHAEFMASDSKGKHHHRFIKAFRAVKLDGISRK